MKFLSILAAAGAISPVVAMPAVKPRAGCTNPAKRVEWRQLSAADQQSYLAAVNCLKTKPSRIGLSSPLYDDFPYVHQKLNKYIHGGPPFLPWHRYFTHVYFSALGECGYQGPGTYWDWTLDYEGLRHSPVMSADRGFGGDGSSTRTEASPDGGRTLKCVDDGPFSQLRPEYLAVKPRDPPLTGGHCLFRNLPEVSEPDAFARMSEMITPGAIVQLQTTGNWTSYHWQLESGPHGVIHASLGGDMNPTTSPNEPLFFLHHSKVDQLWWDWQQRNSSRLAEYDGMASHYNETDDREATLDDMLVMDGLAPDVKVREIIDTVNGELCYTY